MFIMFIIIIISSSSSTTNDNDASINKQRNEQGRLG